MSYTFSFVIYVLRRPGNMYWRSFLRGLFLLLFPINYIYCRYLIQPYKKSTIKTKPLILKQRIPLQTKSKKYIKYSSVFRTEDFFPLKYK